MTPSTFYFARAGRAGADDVLVRTPELRPLHEKVIAQFGVGCLGAPSALEFARAGIGELRVMDHDFVDPATMGRWPFGLSAAGLRKVDVLAEFVRKNYPSTRVVPVAHFLGMARHEKSDIPSDHDIVETMTTGASLIYDATAEIGVQCYLSDLASTLNIPYISVAGTYGGWGGRVVSVAPGRTAGCWMCYRYACADGSIPEPPSDPHGEVQPRGCGDVTFTGASFDMTNVALLAVRTVVATLCCGDPSGYPKPAWDILTLSLRDNRGQLIVPEARGYSLRRHPECPRCNA